MSETDRGEPRSELEVEIKTMIRRGNSDRGAVDMTGKPPVF